MRFFLKARRVELLTPKYTNRKLTKFQTFCQDERASGAENSSRLKIARYAFRTRFAALLIDKTLNQSTIVKPNPA